MYSSITSVMCQERGRKAIERVAMADKGNAYHVSSLVLRDQIDEGALGGPRRALHYC